MTTPAHRFLVAAIGRVVLAAVMEFVPADLAMEIGPAARVMATVLVDLVVETGPDVPAMATDPDGPATVIDQGDLGMATDLEDREMEIGPAGPAIVPAAPVRVAAASSGRDQEIDPIIGPIAIRIGTSGKIGVITSGRTPTTSGATIGTTTTVISAATGGTTVRIGGLTTTSTIGVGPRGRP